LREGTGADRDAWLASLFAPAASRRHVQALYAFAREIARVPDIVSQPTLGEIRLQWWIEALEGARAGEAASHPVASAVLDTIRAFQLPSQALVALVEARRFDLYADPMPSLNDLEGYCGETHGALMRLASMVIAGRDPQGAAAAGHAGVALGIVRILGRLPAQAARSQCFLPRDLLSRHGALPEAVAAGVTADAMDREARVALLPVAVVEPILRRMEARGFDPFRDNAEPPQWRRQWALWWAARRL
jgi:phytoene synthase